MFEFDRKDPSWELRVELCSSIPDFIAASAGPVKIGLKNQVAALS